MFIGFRGFVRVARVLFGFVRAGFIRVYRVYGVYRVCRGYRVYRV